MDMSRILYKYLDIAGAKGMIGNKNLQFTNASQLNDAFDCHPKLIDYSNIPNTRLKGWPKQWWIEKEENDALNLRNDTWLCSLSKVNDSLLMWSHYCYNHKGICIGIDIDKVMKSIPPMFGTIYLEPLVLDVKYNIRYLGIEVIEHIAVTYITAKWNKFNLFIINDFLLLILMQIYF